MGIKTIRRPYKLQTVVEVTSHLQKPGEPCVACVQRRRLVLFQCAGLCTQGKNLITTKIHIWKYTNKLHKYIYIYTRRAHNYEKKLKSDFKW